MIDYSDFEILYDEYECGGFGCTPMGCTGHESDQAIGFYLDGVCYYVNGVESGDFPMCIDKEQRECVNRQLKELEKLFERTNALGRKDDEKRD